MPAAPKEIILSRLRIMNMKSEKELLELIDAYLNDEMTSEERVAFEKLRSEDASLDHKIVAHKDFLRSLDEHAAQKRLYSKMNAIHEQLNVAAIRAEVLPKSTILKTLWNKYRLNAAVAASVAVIAVLATMSTTGYFSKNHATNSHYSDLRREINSIKKSQNDIIKNIKEDSSNMPADPSRFGGTGFALSENGYIVTNFHVIKEAQSVSVQDNEGHSYRVKVIHTDPIYDIAVLKITDTAFKPFKSLPYTFKKTLSDVSEDVYTIGYPKDQPVYGRGYLSSNTGYLGDTIQYQVSIDANLGNSGSPLLDSKGNIIGVIKGKDPETEGAAFAVKSGFLLKTIESIPEDSLDEKLELNKKNGLAGLSRKDQYKKLKDYIFMVKVY